MQTCIYTYNILCICISARPWRTTPFTQADGALQRKVPVFRSRVPKVALFEASAYRIDTFIFLINIYIYICT